MVQDKFKIKTSLIVISFFFCEENLILNYFFTEFHLLKCLLRQEMNSDLAPVL